MTRRSDSSLGIRTVEWMRDNGARYGLATLCVGQGQGVATIFENCAA